MKVTKTMRFKQVYTPNIHAVGIRGLCLGYVDNAGNAPKRTASAKIAYDNEKRAKRIRTSTPPKGVWVIGFASFTKGAYVAYGHVWLMKYLGSGRYEIRDSEVAAGARQPYRNIDELKAWFGAYSPKYSGWSTHCDGREYAEEIQEDKDMLTAGIAAVIVRALCGRKISDKELKAHVGKKTTTEFYREVKGWGTHKDAVKEAKAGKLDATRFLMGEMRTVLKK